MALDLTDYKVSILPSIQNYDNGLFIAAEGSTPNLDIKVSRSLNPVFRADVIPGGGPTGGVREKYLNCVHIICKLFTLDLKVQNIRILPEETRLVWLYFFVLITINSPGIKAMNCLTFILEASNVLL